MMRRYLKYICVCILTMLAVSCQQDEPLDLNGKVMVSYSVRMPARDASRVAIDGSKVNTLIVEVFEKEGETWRSAYRNAGISVSGGSADVNIPLLKHRPYRVVFWAQNNNVTAYDTDDLSHISLDYTHYSNGFESVENLDAFYYVDKVDGLEATSNDNVKVELKRPFVFLNIDNQSEYTPVSTTLTIKKAYTSFYPLTGVMGNAIQNQEFEFTGAKEDGTIAACLVFVSPSENSLDVSLEISNGTSVTTKDVTIETVKANHRYNLEGELVGAPMSHWNEKTELPYYDEANNRYIIQNEAQLAWWMNPVAEELNEGATEIFIEKDLDMQDIPMDALQLPEGITLNGNDKTIERLNLSGGLLGNATNLKVHNLTISHAKVETTSGHVGVLVNTLTGSSTFTGVTITNSSATTSSGAAGSMVGYIKNKEGETLEVTFSGCTAIDNKVNGTITSGVYVGCFRGYNNAETLTFSTDCNPSSATFSSNAVKPYYTTANAACWFTSEQTTAFNKYSGWLGCEEYYRGTINYGDERYIPKWDGTTKAPDLLAEGTTKLVYSAFDFAFLQENSYGSDNPVTIMEDIDLGGYPYTPIKKLSTLNGEYNSIYNLKIEVEKKLYHASLIERTSGTTVHENITFVNPNIRHTHDPNSKGGDAYAAVLCSYNDEGNYTLTNVHVEGGNIYAVNKIGGILGYVATSNITATNCTVRGLTIENYEVLIKDPIFQIRDYVIGFYPHGEVGGLFGFVASNAKIENCHVSESTFKCVGVKEMLWFSDSKIPGRHVNHFIGDIRTTKGQKIEILDCTATNNEYLGQEYSNYESESKGTNFSWYYVLKDRASNSELISSCTYTYNKISPEIELVGCCYYIYCEIYALWGSMYKILADTKGELWIDGIQKF